MIATELITNAAKYAYPAREKGPIRVVLTTGNGDIRLSVSDDGVGLPACFSLTESKGLGMRLVRAFASQLDAKLDVHARPRGLELTLVVPLNHAV